jgi:hypothetical protein
LAPQRATDGRAVLLPGTEPSKEHGKEHGKEQEKDGGDQSQALVCVPGHVKWVGTRTQDDPEFVQDVVRNLERHCLVPGAPGFEFSCGTGGKRVPFPYQRVLGCLLRPDTPVQRTLVVWMTGAGKTQGMVQVLDNYYQDPRPKVVLVPNKKVAENFVSEFIEVDSQYKAFVDRYLTGRNYGGKDFVTSAPKLHKWKCESEHCRAKGGTVNERSYRCVSCSALEKTTALPEVERLLEMNGIAHRAGEPGYPLAPVRTFGYRKAGGAQAVNRTLLPLKFAHSTGKTPGLVARRAKAWPGKDPANPYNHCIVLCDEAHNLVLPDEMKQYQDKRERLKKWLQGAADCTLAAFTATPVPSMGAAETDYAHLMDLVKGTQFKNAPNTGFILYYNTFNPGLFPATTPDLNTCNCLGSFIPVPLQGRNLVKYVAEHNRVFAQKRQHASDAAPVTGGAGNDKKEHRSKHGEGGGGEEEDQGPFTKAQAKLFNYCNMATYSAHAYSEGSKGLGETFRKGLLDDPVGNATKLARLTYDISSRPDEKTLVLVHRTHGFKGLVNAMSLLFDQAGVKWGGLYDADNTYTGTGDATVRAEHEEKNKAATRLIEQFNNFNPSSKKKYADGGEVRVLVADTAVFSEGVSFFGVRRLVLFNPPTSYKDYLQRIGRAFRACKSHISNLPPEDRTVAVDIYVAVIRRADVDALLDADQTVTKRTRKSADVQGGGGGGGGGKGSKGPRTDKGKARAPSRKKSASLRGLHIPEATIDVLAAQHLQRERALYVDFVNANFKDIALDRGLYDGGFQPRGPFGVPASELQAEAKAQAKAKAEAEAKAKAEAGDDKAKAGEDKAKAGEHKAKAGEDKAEAGNKTDEKGDTEKQDSGDAHGDGDRREPHEEGRRHRGRRHDRERSRRHDEYRRDRHGRRSDRHGRHSDRREQGRTEPREYVRITRPRNQVQTPKTQSPRARGLLGKAYDWLTSAGKRGADDPKGKEGHEGKQGKEGKGLLGLGGRWYTLGLGGGDDVRAPGLRPKSRTKVGPQRARSSGKKRLPTAARKRTSRRRPPRK